MWRTYVPFQQPMQLIKMLFKVKTVNTISTNPIGNSTKNAKVNHATKNCHRLMLRQRNALYPELSGKLVPNLSSWFPDGVWWTPNQVSSDIPETGVRAGKIGCIYSKLTRYKISFCSSTIKSSMGFVKSIRTPLHQNRERVMLVVGEMGIC